VPSRGTKQAIPAVARITKPTHAYVSKSVGDVKEQLRHRRLRLERDTETDREPDHQIAEPMPA